MTSQGSKKTAHIINEQLEKDMLRYGIARVSADHFYYGEYKYTDAKDAVAQAKRDEKANSN